MAEIVYVSFKGEQIPMREEEKVVWDKMDFKAQHAQYNQWMDKVKRGVVVKVGEGYVLREYAEKNGLI
jgi:hypothetical protein